jgi:hypothetical protein
MLILYTEVRLIFCRLTSLITDYPSDCAEQAGVGMPGRATITAPGKAGHGLGEPKDLLQFGRDSRKGCTYTALAPDTRGTVTAWSGARTSYPALL